jgi:diadenosine tetraphosphate (Ap4A) HIT family hydrolase
MACELCEQEGGVVLWRDDFCRVVRVAHADYPGFCRVILDRHVAEMTDLTEAQRERMLRVVFACERALRDIMTPDKVNLASFGNVVPHLHWHVIPRFRDDAHFPDSIWAATRRTGAPRAAPADAVLRAGLMEALK